MKILNYIEIILLKLDDIISKLFLSFCNKTFIYFTYRSPVKIFLDQPSSTLTKSTPQGILFSIYWLEYALCDMI